MKTNRIFGILSVALIGLAQPVWATPRGGGAHFGGFAGGARFSGGARAAPSSHGAGFGSAPVYRGNVPYSAGAIAGRISSAPRSYPGRSTVGAIRSRSSLAGDYRSTRPIAVRNLTVRNRPDALARQNAPGLNARAATAGRQANRLSSSAARNRAVRNPQLNRSQAAPVNRQSFVKHHASERHGANWHRDWDKHHAHFHHNRVFVFIDGFWWGLYPWDYYPYWAYDYPSGYDYGSPFDSYNAYYPYDYYQSENRNNSYYAAWGQYLDNQLVSTVQSELAQLGYYRGAIDGLPGEQTEAALANYQEDRDLSVTGTIDAPTLESLGIR
jgi:hypothetical protein